MIQTTFANGLNCFTNASATEKHIPLPAACGLTRHSLAAYLKEIDRPVIATEAAAHFSVKECHIYRMCKSLAKEGCVVRHKTPFLNGAYKSWRYAYTFERESRTATIDHAGPALKYLICNPGSTSSHIRDSTTVGIHAPATLLRMFRSGLVRREWVVGHWVYWAAP